MATAVTITIEPISLVGAFDQYRGESIPGKFDWNAVVILKWNEKSLPMLIVTDFHLDRQAADDRDGWALRLAKASALSIEYGLSAFKENDVTPRLPKTLPKQAVRPVRVSNEVVERLECQHAKDKRARRQFDRALETLKRSAPHPPHPSLNYEWEARDAFRKVNEFLYAGYLGTNRGWYAEKTSMIGRYMDDLARRKDKNHEGYRSAQDYISNTLSIFRAPEAWRSEPPDFEPDGVTDEDDEEDYER